MLYCGLGASLFIYGCSKFAHGSRHGMARTASLMAWLLSRRWRRASRSSRQPRRRTGWNCRCRRLRQRQTRRWWSSAGCRVAGPWHGGSVAAYEARHRGGGHVRAPARGAPHAALLPRQRRRPRADVRALSSSAPTSTSTSWGQIM